MDKLKDKKYIETVGRRKTAVARVRIFKATGGNKFEINAKKLEDYFPTDSQRADVLDPIKKCELSDQFDVTVVVKGGGSESQAEAIRHGIARALVEFDPELRKTLREFDFLKRDPRKKERKKFGLKKARKAPQWSKR